MGLITLLSAIALVSGTFALPQLNPDDAAAPNSPLAPSDPSLVSPWSQWMSLKAPPASLALPKSKKKKLLPGPPPPEGVSEAPWVSWTRMKVNEALSPVSVPPTPLASTSTSASGSSPDPAVYLQWLEMKLPMTNPLSPGPAQETPWDAWTKMKVGPLVGGGPAPDAVQKRMAPDRYTIASTAIPRLAGYPPIPPQINVPKLAGAGSPSRISAPQSPSRAYFDLLGVTPNTSTRLAPSNPGIGRVSVPTTVTRPSMAPPKQTVPPSVILTTILKPIPHQMVAQLLATGTPQEIAQVVETLSTLNDQPPPMDISSLQVGQVLPASFIPKIPDEMTPLLSAPLIRPNPTPEELSLVPGPIREEILAKASPSEEAAVIRVLSAMKSLPPSQQVNIAGLQVGTILPPTLVAKLSPAITALLKKPVVPPVLAAALPSPILSAVLQTATPIEVATLIRTVAEVETLPPTVARPPIGVILPQSVLAKLPSQLAPLLTQPILSPEEEAAPSTPGPLPVAAKAILSAALPPPLYSELVAKATLAELNDIVETIALLEAAVPAVSSPQIATILPQAVLAKLSSTVRPLLASLVVLPPNSPLEVIPPPLLKSVLKVATPEEIPEIIVNIAAMAAAPAPVPKPVSALLPPSVIAKLPMEILPALETPVQVGPKPAPLSSLPASLAKLPPPVLSAVISGLSETPKPLLPAIIASATPEELTTLAETLKKLEAAPAELSPIISKLEVGTILPPSLVAKLPPVVLPLLEKPISLPPSAMAVPPTLAPPSPLTTVVSGLALAPKPVLPAVLAVATPEELMALGETLTELEAAEIKPEVAKIPLGAIMPPSLVAKLPPTVLPMLEAPISLPPAPTPPASPTAMPAVPPTAPSAIPPTTSPSPSPTTEAVPATPPVSPLLKVVSALMLAPKPVMSSVLIAATPPELAKLAETLEELEAVPPTQLPPIAVGAIIPPSLMAKLPPKIAPLLTTPLVLPPPVTAPSTVLATVVPVLVEAPKPVLPLILAKATPEELSELAEVLAKLEAVPPEQKEIVSKLELETILPPTLVAKLPPPIIPMLSTPLVLPPSTVAPPPPVPAAPVIPSVLQAISEPTLAPILAVASLTELEELTETLTKLEEVPPTQLPKLPLITVLPPTLASKLPPTLLTQILEPLPPSPPAAPLEAAVGSPPEIPVATPKETKLLTKWAKVILTKTGSPAPPVPGEIPPLQAAWMEWVQLQLNKTGEAPPPPATPALAQATTDYPWTKWLKLKGNATAAAAPPFPSTIPALDVTTPSPEKAVLEWLETLEKAGLPTTPAIPTVVSPPIEEEVAATLKQLGIENVNLPPEQIAAILAELEKSPPPTPPQVATLPPVPSQFYPVYSSMPFYSPFMPPKPFLRTWPPPPSTFLPPTPPSPPATEALPAPEPTSPPPTINLTEYLIANKMIPPETPPTATIPIPTLAKLLEEEALAPSPESSPTLAPSTEPERVITAAELASLTPTKFAALLKQILKDCNRTNDLLPRSAGYGGGPPYPYYNKGAYYKNKYGSKKKVKHYGRALYPIPSQAFSPTPSTTPSPIHNLLPFPSMNTTGTVVDPAYWAAQKSLFLSKLFSTLAKVVMNETSTPSPKEQLANQANAALMSGMTRSIKHRHKAKPVPESTEYEYSDEEESSSSNEEPTIPDVDESKLASDDNSEPNLPKEPNNPLHKLFKFGVQKTVLSDLSSTTPQPVYVYIPPPTPPTPPPTTTPDKEKDMLDKLQKLLAGKPKKKSFHHHHHHKKVPRFRTTTTTTTTTTPSPVDFELLAKALLEDKTGAKRSAKK